MHTISRLLAMAALLCVPAWAGAEAEDAANADPAATQRAATQDAAEPGAADAGAEAAAQEAPAGEPDLQAYPGVVHKVFADGMVVRRIGRASDPRAPAAMAFAGKVGVPVEGEGKNNWLALRRGDFVMVSYVTGPPHRVTKVNVLPKPRPRVAGMAAPIPAMPNQRRQRTFVGYIKQKEGDSLIVMSPRAAPPARREAEVKAFIRTEDTQVEVLRDSWNELRKGDRVRIGHQKGNPRPIDVVQVIRRGGEEPLPPGLATRLFHPDYDDSVKDVDGIGETRPVRPPPQRPGGGIRLKRPAADAEP